MSNKIIVMKKGEIQQIGSPTDIYNEPKNAFVADFIGESNIIPGIMIKDKLVQFLDKEVKCVDYGFEKNAPVDIVIRPEDVQLLEEDQGLFNGVVESVIFKGVHYEMAIKARDFELLVHSTIKSDVGQTVGIYIKPFDIHVMNRDGTHD
jgi:spermidine/putrescine transport system ATP-binding protein